MPAVPGLACIPKQNVLRSKSNIVDGSCSNMALSRSENTASEGTDGQIGGGGGERDPAFFRRVHGLATPYAVRHTGRRAFHHRHRYVERTSTTCSQFKQLI